ncbi:hypothetical protein CBS101457_005656 [Exobasidium rhododendri]|nr:hypothetical protein CBS101457_005656 [Exobasidium rhododendri]
MSYYDRSIHGESCEPISSITLQKSHVNYKRYADLAENLKGTISGSVHTRNEDDDKLSLQPSALPDSDEEQTGLGESAIQRSEFAASTRLFNTAAPLSAWMVVKPRNTGDVVTTIKFCHSHGLSPSVKSGGFSTSGWAIQGDVVLDMQLMNGVEMLSPQKFAERKSPPEPSPLDDQSKRAKTDRTHGMDDGELDDHSNKMQRTNRVESGDDAGIPQSSDSNASSSPSATHDPVEDGHQIDKLGTSVDRLMSDQIASPKQTNDEENEPSKDRSTSWIDQSMDKATSSGQSESTNSLSRSSTSNGDHSAPTSGDVESEGKEEEVEAHAESAHADNDTSTHWDPTSTFEHERWQKHHCPPGPSVTRARLPATGGFIWRADDAESNNEGSSSGMGHTRILDSNEPVYLGGSTFDELRATSGLNGHLNEFGIGEMRNPEEGWSPNEGQDTLKPGIHKDKFQLVEFGPGVTLREVDTFTESAGRTPNRRQSLGKEKAVEEVENVRVGESGFDFMVKGVPYHVPLSAYPVGTTSMTTGGFGYLSRAYGLSLDNLVEVELVLANGKVVVLNDSSKNASIEEADLWWAIRGAAPCFGVITRLVAKAYPVPKVYSGNLIYPFNSITAPSLLRHWRDCLKGTGGSIPRELYSNLILTAGPPSETILHREHVIVIQICFLGSSAPGEAGEDFVQAISSWTGERVLLKDMAEKSFLNQQDGVAQVLKNGKGKRWMVRGDLLSTLSDEVIYKTVDHFHKMGSNRAVWFFELIGGAIEDSTDTCVGADQRKAKFTVAALQQWKDEEEDEKCVSGVEAWIEEVLCSVSIGGPFPCFLERREKKSRCIGSFGAENYKKLIGIKRRVDPLGMFKHTFASGLTE